MAFTPEIKSFVKKTFLFTFIFAIAIHFFWESIATMLGFSARAHNDGNFENANITYIGNTAAALSLRLGGISENNSTSNNTAIFQTSDIVSIDEVLSNPSIGQEKLIATNMLAITAYANVLKMDILEILNTSSNRSAALENHISLLKSYYRKTEEQLSIIRDQKNDIKALAEKTVQEEKEAKNTLQWSYNSLEYTGVDGAISKLLQAKNLNTRVKIYNVYLERFEKSYQALQAKNIKVLDAITNNRRALIEKNIVVIPDTGSDIIKELGLIQSEADYKAQKVLE